MPKPPLHRSPQAVQLPVAGAVVTACAGGASVAFAVRCLDFLLYRLPVIVAS